MRWFRRIFFVVLVGALFFAALRFSSENAEPVMIYYLAGEPAVLALWQALALAACAGALLIAIPLGYLWTRSGLLAWQYRRTMSRQEAEIHQLRNLPLAPPGSAGPDEASEAFPRPASGGTAGSGA